MHSLPIPNDFIRKVDVRSGIGWTAGKKPVAAEGMTVVAFAQGLDHPRGLYVLPNGDVLVAETNVPPQPEDANGIKGWVFKQLQAKAMAADSNANRIRSCAMQMATVSPRHARYSSWG